MKKFLPSSFLLFILLPFLSAQPAVGTWTSQSGSFPPGQWQELLYGGGEGLPGNEIQAWSDGYFALTGAQIMLSEGVVQLQGCEPVGEGENTEYPALVYRTIYSGGTLELANAGTPWETTDPTGTFTVALGPLTNVTTKFTAENSCDTTGVISFDLSGVGTIEGYEGWHVFVNAHYTGTPSLGGTDPAELSDTFDETGFVSLSISPPAGLDIKPGSCVNPFNLKSRGVLPVALLGSDLVDVSDIDPATLIIQSFVVISNSNPSEPVTIFVDGIAPLRWSWEDVTGPGDCGYEAPDGWTDLVAKFSSEEISAALGDVADGDEVWLTLTANLNLNADGEDGHVTVPLIAQDFVTVLDKGRQRSENPGVGNSNRGDLPGNRNGKETGNRGNGKSGNGNDGSDNGNRSNRGDPPHNRGGNG